MLNRLIVARLQRVDTFRGCQGTEHTKGRLHMRPVYWLAPLGLGVAVRQAYIRRRRQMLSTAIPRPDTAARAVDLLTRATPLLRLATSPDRPPEVLPDGSGLRCAGTGRMYPYVDGVLDLLPADVTLTETQHVLNTPLSAWAYDTLRNRLMRFLGLPSFPAEVAAIQHHLQADAGDTILDLACGHGNFTIEWAKRVGAAGLIIGLDISGPMLARAAEHARQWDLANVLLIRGDALRLPFADNAFPKVNCSGGFHQLPDLPLALQEIARVSSPTAVLTASTFAEGQDDQFAALKRWLKRTYALHFVPLAPLGEQLASLGYHDYQWSLPGGWFGYSSAHKKPIEGNKAGVVWPGALRERAPASGSGLQDSHSGVTNK